MHFAAWNNFTNLETHTDLTPHAQDEEEHDAPKLYIPLVSKRLYKIYWKLFQKKIISPYKSTFSANYWLRDPVHPNTGKKGKNKQLRKEISDADR